MKDKKDYGKCPKCGSELDIIYYYPDVGATDGICYCPKCDWVETGECQ